MNKSEIFFTPCVCVEIQGVPHSEGFPYIYDDAGLISEFNQWSLGEKIYPNVSGGHCGAGHYKGFYSQEDADKIGLWLRDKVEE